MDKPVEFDMMKYTDGVIVVNRKFTVSGDSGRITLRVTERNYQEDPTGQKVTPVFEGEYESLDDAKVGFQKHCQAAKDEGFIENRMDVSKFGW